MLYYYKIFITCLLCVCTSFVVTAQGSDCKSSIYNREVAVIDTMITQSLSKRAIPIGDSLYQRMEQAGQGECRIALLLLWHLAEGYEHSRKSSTALQYYYKILPISLENGFWDIAAKTYVSLSRVHEANGRGIDAKRNLDQAIKIIDEHKVDSLRAIFYMRSSSYYRIYEQNIDTAIYLAQKGIEYGKMFNIARPQYDGYMLLGMLTDNDEARLSYFAQGRDIAFDYKVYQTCCILNNSVAGQYITLGNLDAAEQTARKTFEYEKFLLKIQPERGKTAYSILQRCHAMLQRVFERKGQIDSAYHHLELSSAYGERNNYTYDQDKINQIEIENAIKIEQIKSNQLKSNLNTLLVVLVLVALLLLALTFLLYSFVKNRKELKTQKEVIERHYEEVLSLTKSQGILLSEVHHRVKNNLQNIISLLFLQSNKIKNEAFKQSLTDISSKIRSIALIHDQLYQSGEYEQIELERYFNELVGHFNSIQKSSKPFIFHINTNSLHLNIETLIPLGIICSELITNSIKYANVKEDDLVLNIQIIPIENSLFEFVYKDNGVGYSEGLNRPSENGIGKMLIDSMSRQLMGSSVFFNDQGAGFRLKFKEKYVSKI